MDATDQTADPTHSVKRGRPRKAAEIATSPAQELALRIWAGQSPDAPIPWRVERIVSALKERGLPLNITLPDDDAERHLEAY